MSFTLTGNFLSNARGVNFVDGGGVTWTFNPNTNTVTATASGGGGGTVTSIGSTSLTIGGTSAVPTVNLSSTQISNIAAGGTALQTAAVADSIQGTGVSGSPLELVGDSASPGNSFLYGTNSSGVKGWYAQPSGSASYATPTTKVGLTAVAGSATSGIRSDGAPALDVSIAPTWTSPHIFAPGSGTAMTVTGVGSNFTALFNGASGNAVAVGLTDGGTGTRNYQLRVGQVSIGKFDIFDNTANASRLTIDPSTGAVNAVSDLQVAGVSVKQVATAQSANTVFAGPASGSSAQPGFRVMVAADLPALTPLGSYNLTIDGHASTPTGVGVGPNDEFEQSLGTAIDTAGTRYSGATAWTAFNLGTGSSSQSGSGTLLFTPQVGAGVNYSGYTQPVPVSGSYTYLLKISAAALTSSQLFGMMVATSSGASGKIYLFGVSVNAITAQRATNSTTFSSNPSIVAWNNTLGTSPGTTGYGYLQFSWNAATTTLTCSMSLTGAPGTFTTLISETAAAFLGTPALIGFGAENQASANAIGNVDFFRRIA